MNAHATDTQTQEEDQSTQSDSSCKSTSDWLAERKTELRKVLENKSRELGRKAQDSLSNKMGHYESALAKASESLESDSEAQPAKIAANLAQQIKESADYLQNTSPEEIVEQASQRVRKSPLIAIGAAIAAGFLAGRIINSAREIEETSA